MNRRQLILVGAAALAAPSIARAQGRYPDRTIRFVIPFAPGGPTDIIGRMAADKLTAILGQQVIVDNKAGATGSIGAVDVKNARPDGYTLLCAPSSTHAINPTAFVKPAYDAVKDFTPIASICVNPLVLVARPDMPDTVMGLVELMKKNPGKYSYGSSGAGSIINLAGEYFKREVGGMDVEHIPYKGSMPALQDMMGGQTAWMFETFSTTLQLHKAGKVRILAYAYRPARTDRAGNPDDDRSRRKGLRGLHVQPDSGSGQRPAAGRRRARSGVAPNDEGSGHNQVPGRHRGGAVDRHLAASHGEVHQGRDREMGAGDPRRRHQDRVARSLSDILPAEARCPVPG